MFRILKEFAVCKLIIGRMLIKKIRFYQYSDDPFDGTPVAISSDK